MVMVVDSAYHQLVPSWARALTAVNISCVLGSMGAKRREGCGVARAHGCGCLMDSAPLPSEEGEMVPTSELVILHGRCPRSLLQVACLSTSRGVECEGMQ